MRRHGSNFTWYQTFINQTALYVHHFRRYSERRCAYKLIKQQSLVQNRIRLERSVSARKSKTVIYNCFCEALRDHPEMWRSTNVHIKNNETLCTVVFHGTARYFNQDSVYVSLRACVREYAQHASLLAVSGQAGSIHLFPVV